jgi:hypothetical protein
VTGQVVQLAVAIACTIGLLAMTAFDAGGRLMNAVGPLGALVLWIPGALWAAAAMLDLAGRRGAGAAALCARTGVWAVLMISALDPAPNWPDRVATQVQVATAGISAALYGLVGLAIGACILAALVAALMKPSSEEGETTSRRKQATTGSAVHPAIALLARSVVRALISSLALLVWLLLAVTAWTAVGIRGLWAFARRREGEHKPVDMLLRCGAVAGSLLGGVGQRFLVASSGWGKRQRLGVWLSPAALERDAEGQLHEEPWELGAQPGEEVVELAELTQGLLAAFDVALTLGDRPRNPSGPEAADGRRQAAPKLHPYRLEVARAWSRADYHAVVIRATPAAAGAAMAKLEAEQLLPALDSTTRWTRQELGRLRLSDPRVGSDPMRDGQVGLFVAFDRAANSDVDVIGQGPTPVQRALDEAGLSTRFRYLSTDEGFDVDIHEYSAQFASAAEWRALEAKWRELQPAVALYSRNSGAKTESIVDTQRFRVVLPKPAPSFPSGDETAWEKVVQRHRAMLAGDALRFIIGMDHQGEPVFMELGNATAHLLIAGGTGSGKTRSGLFSPLLQLLAFHSPAAIRIWLLDSVKREMSSVFQRAPHVERCVVAEDGSDVVASLEAFVAEMDSRYRHLGGRERSPHDGPAHLLVIEEWADLRDLLDKQQLETVIRCVNRVGQIGRSAGFHLLLVTQKASAEVIPPRLKTNFKGRVAGFFAQASDYGILFDVHRRLLPNVPGRMVVSDGVSLTVAQGLFIGNDQMRAVLDALVRRWPAHGPTNQIATESSRLPTQREIDELSLLTLARLVYDIEADGPEAPVVSVRGVIEYIRGLGLVPGRAERFTAGLARLEAAGVLERTGDHPTAARRLVPMEWPEVEARLRPPVSLAVSEEP